MQPFKGLSHKLWIKKQMYLWELFCWISLMVHMGHIRPAQSVSMRRLKMSSICLCFHFQNKANDDFILDWPMATIATETGLRPVMAFSINALWPSTVLNRLFLSLMVLEWVIDAHLPEQGRGPWVSSEIIWMQLVERINHSKKNDYAFHRVQKQLTHIAKTVMSMR